MSIDYNPDEGLGYALRDDTVGYSLINHSRLVRLGSHVEKLERRLMLNEFLGT